MNLSPRKQTFFHCFFSSLAHRHLGGVWGAGWGRGARTNYCWQIFGCSVTVMCRVMSGWYRPVIGVTYRLSGAALGIIYSAGSCAVYSVHWPRRSHGSVHGPADSLSWLSTTKKSLGCQNPAHRSNQLVNSSWQFSGSYPRHLSVTYQTYTTRVT